MRHVARAARWLFPTPTRKTATQQFCGNSCRPALQAAAKGRVPLLFAPGFAHELLKPCEVGHPEVATLAAQQTDRGKPAQFARDRLTMRADAVGNIGKGWRRGQQRLPVLLTHICRKPKQLGMDSILNHKRAELEHPLGQSPHLRCYMPNRSNSDHRVGQQKAFKLAGGQRGDRRPLYSLHARRTRCTINRGDFAEHRTGLRSVKGQPCHQPSRR